MTKQREHRGPVTRREARKPKIDYNQNFTLCRNKDEERRE